MPQWTLFENDFRSIDQVLNELLEKTNALSAHLVDRSGQLITTAGRTGDFDATAFASLVAADFTANAELALLLDADLSVDVDIPNVLSSMVIKPTHLLSALSTNATWMKRRCISASNDSSGVASVVVRYGLASLSRFGAPSSL